MRVDAWVKPFFAITYKANNAQGIIPFGITGYFGSVYLGGTTFLPARGDTAAVTSRSKITLVRTAYTLCSNLMWLNTKKHNVSADPAY